MRKGFGLYAPHETTAFLLKTILVSFWIGIDTIAAMFAWRITYDDTGHRLLMMAALLVLASGTVFALLFTWVTGSLFAKNPDDATQGRWQRFSQSIKQDPVRILCVGAGTVTVVVAAAACHAFLFDGDRQAGSMSCVNPALAEKCAEVARLEGKLFLSDEREVLSKCLEQYGRR
ncbi:MAG TPA: hypothetical protein VEC35_14855 [Noviherbaspirillum sp.]|nr:hypothetical protein [Noviherbaspirillum sp.]